MEICDDITLNDVCAFLEANGDSGFAAELNALDDGLDAAATKMSTPSLPENRAPHNGICHVDAEAATASVATFPALEAAAPMASLPLNGFAHHAPKASLPLTGFTEVAVADGPPVSVEEQQLTALPGDKGDPAASGKSHICTWPGCGKGFNSRWSLERHAKNHSEPIAQLQDADSFVERRLRERLKGVEVALDRARERQGAHDKQQEQADAELSDARLQSEQQHAELRYLLRENALMTAQITQISGAAAVNCSAVGAQLNRESMARALELQQLSAGMGEAGALLMAAGVVVAPQDGSACALAPPHNDAVPVHSDVQGGDEGGG